MNIIENSKMNIIKILNNLFKVKKKINLLKINYHRINRNKIELKMSKLSSFLNIFTRGRSNSIK
jgi:hypothetical protein